MISIRFEGALQDVLKDMKEFIERVETPTQPAPVQSVKPEEQAIPKPIKEKAVEKPVPAMNTPPTEAPSLDDVKAMSVRLAKAKGRQTVVDLLKEFGAQSGADVKESDRATYIAKAQAMLPA